jgi:hypothetical protein
MRTARLVILSLLILALTVPAVFASATVEQHTTMKFGGMIGRMANRFGGKAAKEGLDSLTVVKGDRRISRNGDMAEIVDLGEEKIYTLNAKNQTYTVMTFAEFRKQFEDMKKQMDSSSAEGSGEKRQGSEYTVDVDVRETGAKDSIGGFEAKQVIVTVTSHEKGKKLEESGGGVLTADMWMAPKVAALDEVAAFERRYLQKIWGDTLDVRSFAALAAMAPGFADAMKKFQQKSESLTGTPVRTTMTYESVAGTAPRQAEQSDSSVDPAAGAARMIGGLLAKRAKKTEATEQGTAAGAANRSMLFTSTNVLTKAALTADEAQLAIPADYKLKK